MILFYNFYFKPEELLQVEISLFTLKRTEESYNRLKFMQLYIYANE